MTAFEPTSPGRPPRTASTPVRERILDAATHILREGGDLTVAAVAERAGVSRGTLYRHVGNRDRLAAALEQRGDIAAGEATVADGRERILDAVGRLLAERGLASTTIEAVAGEAGVSAMTVYRHFGDRGGLFAAFLSERTPRARVRHILARAREDDLAGGLRALARDTIAFFRGHPHIVRLFLAPDPESAELVGAMSRGPIGSTPRSPATSGATSAPAACVATGPKTWP